jgi:hypothetical protein
MLNDEECFLFDSRWIGPIGPKRFVLELSGREIYARQMLRTRQCFVNNSISHHTWKIIWLASSALYLMTNGIVEG